LMRIKIQSLQIKMWRKILGKFLHTTNC